MEINIVYHLNFSFQSKWGYKLVFSYYTEGIYPVFWWGLGNNEIYKYTLKYVEVQERVYNPTKTKIADAVEYMLQHHSLLSVGAEIPVNVFIRDLAAHIFNGARVGGVEDVVEIQKNIQKYIEGLIEYIKVSSLSNLTEFNKVYDTYTYMPNTLSYNHIMDISRFNAKGVGINNILSTAPHTYKQIVNSQEISIVTTTASVDSINEVTWFTCKDLLPILGVFRHQDKQVHGYAPIMKHDSIPVEYVKDTDITGYSPLQIHVVNELMLPKDPIKNILPENTIDRLNQLSLRPVDIKSINEFIKNTVNTMSTSVTNELRKDDHTLSEQESSHNLFKLNHKDAQVDDGEVIEHLMHSAEPLPSGIDNTECISAVEGVPNDISKIVYKQLNIQVELDKRLHALIEPNVKVHKYSPKYTNPEIAVDKSDIVTISYNPAHDADKHKHKAVRFGKRWRYVHGDVHDNIWLTPTYTDLGDRTLRRGEEIDNFIGTMKQIVADSTALNSNALAMRFYIQTHLDKWKHNYSWTSEDYAFHFNMYYVMDEAIDIFNSQLLSATTPLEFKNDMGEVLHYVEAILKSTYITPYAGEKRLLTVEAQISLKAMLDFVLFVEQLIYVNRFFYASSRAYTALKSLDRLIVEWDEEQRPEADAPMEYVFIVRWFRWMLLGHTNMNEFNMELDGLQKVTYVKDIIVDYFTSRWGRRVVKYGEDGMYIYSKDYSYINRHRGIRHGWLEDNFNVKNIKDVYNVDRTDMPYDIDTDTPNSTRTP